MNSIISVAVLVILCSSNIIKKKLGGGGGARGSVNESPVLDGILTLLGVAAGCGSRFPDS